jgi:hypothetical protein
MRQSGSKALQSAQWLAILALTLAGSFLQAETVDTSAGPAYDVVLAETVYGSPIKIGLSQTGVTPSGKARPTIKWILRQPDGKTLDSGVFQYG